MMERVVLWLLCVCQCVQTFHFKASRVMPAAVSATIDIFTPWVRHHKILEEEEKIWREHKKAKAVASMPDHWKLNQ